MAWADEVVLTFHEDTGMITGTWLDYMEDEELAHIVADDAHIVAALFVEASNLLRACRTLCHADSEKAPLAIALALNDLKSIIERIHSPS